MNTLVTIFSGPGSQFRVRELAPDTTQVLTMKWAGCFDSAVEYVRANYGDGEAVSPDDFRNEVLRRRHAVVRNR
jgi:hypothetical protein